MRLWSSLIGIVTFLNGPMALAHDGGLPHVHIGEGIATIDVLVGAALALIAAGIWMAHRRRAAARER